MATGGFSKTSINFFRSGAALLNVGTPSLRKLLEQKAISTPGITTVKDLLFYPNNKHKFQKMYPRVLQKSQLEMLYPVSGHSPNIQSWDITLLCLVLSTVCSLTAPEKSLINKLRSLRNEVYGHKPEASMDDAEFESVWNNIETTIKGILKHINSQEFADRMQVELVAIKGSSIDTELKQEIERVIQREVEVLYERIEDIGTKVDEIATSQEGISNAFNRSAARGSASIEDIQTDLMKLYEGLNIPVAPLLSEEEDVNISDLYTDLTIYDVTDQRTFSTSVVASEQSSITSYKELFQTGSRLLNFLVGNAGCGKSSYCRKLISTWCSSVEKSRSVSPLSDDESQMSKFDLLLFIPLSDVDNCNSVGEMIKEVFAMHAVPNCESIIDVLCSPETNCLLVLDGLDEWECQSPKNLKYLLNLNCSKLVTSRHWALDIVPKNYQGRFLEIKPMEEENTRVLVGNILQHVYHVSEERLETKTEQFLTDLRRNNLMEIVEIPLMLTYFVCLWSEEGGLDVSFASNYGGLVDNLIKNCVRRDMRQSFSNKASDFQSMSIKLPAPLSFRQHCVENSFVLYKLGCFAFESLLHGSRAYGENDAENRIGKKVFDMGLKIGLLSKRRVTGHIAHVKYKVQFLHRSIQEFLAALWIVLPDSESFNELKRHCTSLEKLLDLQNVFQFICGLKPSLFNMLSEFAVNVATNSDAVQTYRHSLDSMYGRTSDRTNTYLIAKEVQDMVLAAFNEANINRKYAGCMQGDYIQQYHGGIFYVSEFSPTFHIQDLIIDDKMEEMLGHIQLNKDLKSLHVDGSFNHVKDISGHIKASKSIERLYLDPSISSLFFEIPCRNICGLRSLTVSLERVSGLPEQFKYLKHLSALCLYISGSNSTIASLMEYFSNATLLTELTIEQIECVERDGLSGDRKFVLDLRKNILLKRLSIDKVSEVTVLLSPGVKLEDVSLGGLMTNPGAVMPYLRGSESLTYITLGDMLAFSLFRWNEEDVKYILKIIPTLKRLKYLHLMGIDFKDRGLTFAEDATNLETVYIENVDMTGDCWKDTFHSLLAIKHNTSETHVLVSSRSIGKEEVHFINTIERFDNVIVTPKSDGYIIRFGVKGD